MQHVGERLARSLPWLQVAERRQPVVASSSGADERLHAMRWRLAAGERPAVPSVDGCGRSPVTDDDVRAKRVYEPAAPDDGYRVLVDHIWPRGVSREHAKLDEWARQLAPSGELREWFNHIPKRFPEFRKRYRAELKSQTKELDALRARARKGRVTIVYAARDQEHNNAVVVAEALRDG